MCRGKPKNGKSRQTMLSVMKTLSLPLSPVGQHPASFLQLNPRRSNRQAAGEQRDDSIALARWALQELLTANLHHSCTRITLKENWLKWRPTLICTSLQHRSYILADLLFFYMSHCEPPTTWDDFSLRLEIPQDSTHYHHHHLAMLFFLRFIVKSADCRFKVHYIITLTSLSIT